MSTRLLRQHLAEGGVALFDLTARAKFRLSGADRVRYLNGQVSNDVRKIGPGEARPACVMTAKGKMNGLIWVCTGDDALFLDTEEALRESLAMRLERYIIADDAVLDDVTEEQGLVHLLGVSTLPEEGVTLPDGVSWRRSKRFGVEGVDVSGPAALCAALVRGESGALEGALKAALGGRGILRVGSEVAEVFRIECGVPLWGRELDEDTIPVEAGLEGETIDYHKGCYIGQEIISRIRSVGRVNRNLRGFLLSAPVAAGTPLLDGEKPAGVLTSVTWSDAADSVIALGYLRRGIEESAVLRAGDADATVRPLPLEVL